jgi:hypothetical protein
MPVTEVVNYLFKLNNYIDSIENNPKHDYYDVDMANGLTSRLLVAAEREIAKRRGLTLAQLRDALDAVSSPPPPAPAAPRLKWDVDRDPDETPAAFAWRAYAAEAKAGTLHRGVIAHEDKLLHKKLSNWLRTYPMPEGIDIPTETQWNTQQLAKAAPDEAAREAIRLNAVAKTRASRAAAKPPAPGLRPQRDRKSTLG